MKKIFIILVCLLLISCQKNEQYGTYNNDELWSLNSFSDESLNSNLILENEFSISLWYKGYSNKTGTNIVTLGNDTNFIKLVTSGYDGINYSGLTLYDDGSNWVIADGKDTLKSNRFNHIVLNIKGKSAEIFLNGEAVASGKIDNNLNDNKIIIGEKDLGFYSEVNIQNKITSSKDVLKQYEKKLPYVLLDTINISESDDMIHDFWLEDFMIDGYLVRWQSDNQEVIDYRGVIMKEVDEDTKVNLTATIDINGNIAQKTFPVYVRSNTPQMNLIRDMDLLSNYINRIMYSNDILPTVLNNGSTVTFSVMGDAKIIDNKLIKTGDDEKSEITLTATVSDGLFNQEMSYEIILLDEIEAYIMAYFNGELNEETAYLAYSLDGLTWKKLNTKITTELGSKRIRDPFISRDKAGNFMMLATEGFDNPNIYIFKSSELLAFDIQTLQQIAYFDEGLRMTGKRAWAPEFIYDPDINKYYVYFSDNGFVDNEKHKGGPIFATITEDFEEFSYPYMYFNPGYSVIDGTIAKVDGINYLFYKDERKAAQTIFYAESNHLHSFNKAHDDKFLHLIKYMEGPFIFKDKNGGNFIYMDNYPNQTFYAGHFNHLKEKSDLNWFNTDEIILPEEIVRHGSVVPITKKELEKIIEKY